MLIVSVFGMSELSPIATLTPLPPKNLDTVGVPVPSTFAKVIYLGTGDSRGPYEPGELCIKGPQVGSNVLCNSGMFNHNISLLNDNKHFHHMTLK